MRTSRRGMGPSLTRARLARLVRRMLPRRVGPPPPPPPPASSPAAARMHSQQRPPTPPAPTSTPHRRCRPRRHCGGPDGQALAAWPPSRPSRDLGPPSRTAASQNAAGSPDGSGQREWLGWLGVSGPALQQVGSIPARRDGPGRQAALVKYDSGALGRERSRRAG
jgi:hypothetical protein